MSALPRLTLPSGGWVEFNDPDNFRGKDIKRLRKHLNFEGRADRLEYLLSTGMALLVDRWEIPYLPGAPIPAADEAITDGLTGRDLKALENHISPAILAAVRDDEPSPDSTGPGSPTPPASE